MALQPIPQQRIIEKLDEYMSRRDYAAVERHLHYWLEEARAAGDRRGELTLRNELVGHYRKVGDGPASLQNADEALAIVEELGLDDTVSAGTTYTNVATACNAFGQNERSLQLFQKAARVYEENPRTEPQLLGGLYNNMGLTCVALRRFDEADALFHRALDVMQDVPNGQLEQAITYLNMADAAMAQAGAPLDAPEPSAPQGEYERREAEAQGYLDKAQELLDTPSVPRDGYYAFVCEKCASAFGYHGYFLVEEDLKARAKEIYERA